jgi:hypothetical protein
MYKSTFEEVTSSKEPWEFQNIETLSNIRANISYSGRENKKKKKNNYFGPRHKM